MRILIIYNSFQLPGGDETYVKSIIKLLQKKGHEVILYTKDSNDIKPVLTSQISVFFKLFWNRQAEKELSKIIEKNKPDIAYIQNIFPLINPTAYKICKKYNLPTVQRIHDYRLVCMKLFLLRNNRVCLECLGKKFFYPGVIHGCYRKSRLASFAMAFAFLYYKLYDLFNLVDLYIFPTAFTRNLYIKNKIVPKRKTDILPTMFHGEGNLEKIKKATNRHFIFVGRFAEEKGILNLLDVFKNLPDIKLKVVGWGPLSEVVKRYARYKNIEVIGKTSKKKILSLMKQALATIIPSTTYDVLPNVLIESFAAGRPVIVPNHGPFVNLVQEGKTGFFFAPGDNNDLRDKIISVNDRLKMLPGLTAHIEKEFNRRYRQNIHYQKLMRIFFSLANKKWK